MTDFAQAPARRTKQPLRQQLREISNQQPSLRTAPTEKKTLSSRPAGAGAGVGDARGGGAAPTAAGAPTTHDVISAVADELASKMCEQQGWSDGLRVAVQRGDLSAAEALVHAGANVHSTGELTGWAAPSHSLRASISRGDGTGNGSSP